MNAQQMIDFLATAELDGRHQPDTRRMMRNERMTLQACAQRLADLERVRSPDDGHPTKLREAKTRVGEALAEAERVARSWGVLE